MVKRVSRSSKKPTVTPNKSLVKTPTPKPSTPEQTNKSALVEKLDPLFASYCREVLTSAAVKGEGVWRVVEAVERLLAWRLERQCQVLATSD